MVPLASLASTAGLLAPEGALLEEPLLHAASAIAIPSMPAAPSRQATREAARSPRGRRGCRCLLLIPIVPHFSGSNYEPSARRLWPPCRVLLTSARLPV